MENNLVSLSRVFLNINNPADKRGLVFNQGDILRGVVKDVDASGMVRVLIQGRLIEAMAEAAVNSGQNLNLLVEEVQPGRITLKVLTPEVMNRLEQANLAAQLKEIGFIPSEDNITLARNLLENHLPVNRSTMGQGVQILQHLGGSTPESLRAAAWAVKNNIPVNQELLARVMNFFNSKPDIASLYQQISQILARFQPSLDSAHTFTSPVPASSLAAQPDARAAGSQTTAAPGTFGQVYDEADLLRGASTAGINQSENPAPGTASRGSSGLVVSNFQPGTGENVKQVPVSPSVLPAASTVTVSKLWPLVQTLLENLAVGGDGAAKPILAQLQQTVISRPDLLQGLLMTEGVLETSLPENHPLRELAAVIKGLEHELSGQQIVNTMSRFAPDTVFPGLYLTFPFQIDSNQYTMCELRLHRDQHQTNRQKDTLQIAVSLDTPKMGIVLFHVTWKRSGTLDIQAVVEKETVRAFLQKHWTELSTGLEQQGYQVNNLGIKVADARTEAESLRPALQSASVPNIRPISIDITV